MMKIILATLSLVLVVTGCTKEKGIIETQLVVSQTDLSIPTDYDIVDFDCMSENDIFAIGYKTNQVKLFLSHNGGESWEELYWPLGQSLGIDQVKSVVYMDDMNLAFVVDNRLFRSFNGGQTWSVESGMGSPSYVFFAGKYNGQLLVVENNDNQPNDVLVTPYDQSNFVVLGTMPAPYIDFDKGHLNDDFIGFVSLQNDFFYGTTYGYDLVSNQVIIKEYYGNAYDRPMDILPLGQDVLMIREGGKLNYLMGLMGSYGETYNYHANNYYSGEDMGGYVVVVGDNTISTNYNGDFEEAIPTGDITELNLYYKVKKANATHFYISGEKGLFNKATFQ